MAQEEQQTEEAQQNATPGAQTAATEEEAAAVAEAETQPDAVTDESAEAGSEPAENVETRDAASEEKAADEEISGAEADAVVASESAPAAEAKAEADTAAEEEEQAQPALAARTNGGPGNAKHEATIEELLKAGAHFGHLTSRWHPRMEPYIFMKRNNIHIIDLMQTQVLLDRAADAARRFAKRGKSILFTGTKKQAQEIVRKYAEATEQPFMVERWLGGTMTNFQTIRRSIRRMEDIEKMESDGTLDKLKKKEKLVRLREHEKLEGTLGGIRQMPSLPGALYVVDVKRENIAVSEAKKLGIPIIAMTDTNCDPNPIDYPIPANDDALSSIELITSIIARAITDGQGERQAEQQAKQKQNA